MESKQNRQYKAKEIRLIEFQRDIIMTGLIIKVFIMGMINKY